MDNTWITIYVFLYAQDSYVIKSKLEDLGIPCNLKDELTVQAYNFISNAVGGVKLQVHPENVDEAVELMKEAGYDFSYTPETSKILATFDRLTARIPVMGKIPFLWRFLFFATAGIFLALFAIYYATDIHTR